MTTHSTPALPAASQRLRRTLVVIAFGLLLGALVAFFATFWPNGVDYTKFYYPAARAFSAGNTRLYDDASRGFYNLPWFMLILVPLTALPFKVGQAVLITGSMGLFVFASGLLRTDDRRFPAWAIFLAAANLHALDVFVRGQVDALILLGVLLGWWAIQRRQPWALAAAFWLLSVKPLNVALTALLFFYAIRQWSWQDLAKVVSLTVLAFVLSFPQAGWDWPLRYIANYRAEAPPDFLAPTLWRGADLLGLWPWLPLPFALLALAGCGWQVARRGLDEWTLSLALTTNLVFTQYATGNHYVLLIPVLLFVAQRAAPWTLLAYALTFTPLLRSLWGNAVAPLDLGYPLVLMAAAWWFVLREPVAAPVSQPASVTPKPAPVPAPPPALAPGPKPHPALAASTKPKPRPAHPVKTSSAPYAGGRTTTSGARPHSGLSNG